MTNLLTILTSRCGSERYPNKAIQEVAGKPLIKWIIERYKALPGNLVLATTSQPENDILEAIGHDSDVEVFRYTGDPNDVVGRMDAVVGQHPEATHIMRGLGDMPFICRTVVKRALTVLERTQKEMFLWMQNPDYPPIYGCRETPISRTAFQRIVNNAKGEEREHVDMWMHRHRNRFSVAYHEPPSFSYYRFYRFEIDWPQDIATIKHIAEDGPGMLASVKEIVRWVDNNNWALKNNGLVEKTGILTSYDYKLRRQWYVLMEGNEVITWNNEVWEPPDEKAPPVFCNASRCFLGWGYRGKLHTKEGHILAGPDWVTCSCGTGRFWRVSV